MDLFMSLVVLLLLAHLPLVGILGSVGNAWARREIVGLTSPAARRALILEFLAGLYIVAMGVTFALQGLADAEDAFWVVMLGLAAVFCGIVHWGARWMLLRRGIRSIDDLDRYRRAQGIAS
jgi:hypothetical protein